ncbi:hypothetical protein [Streptococcus anginosus]|uniref:hypothetical protein n=1 Tax=Streptococcus anginosus TaxID=1328 RepID=UPI0021F87B30|nr:hypothetical protein [Streptococcus anginosus]MCW1014848.1 hypothetical protein [Streptococcus anginosus]
MRRWIKIMKIKKQIKHKNVIRFFSLALASLMILSMSWTPITYAENLQYGPQSEPQVVTPVKEEPSSIKSNEEQGGDLEIGPEIVDQPVGAAIPAPTINKVFSTPQPFPAVRYTKIRLIKRL